MDKRLLTYLFLNYKPTRTRHFNMYWFENRDGKLKTLHYIINEFYGRTTSSE